MLATVFASYMTFQEYLIFSEAQCHLLVQEFFLVCCIHAKEVGFNNMVCHRRPCNNAESLISVNFLKYLEFWSQNMIAIKLHYGT